MEELWIIESGIKRRAKKFVCQFCCQEFLGRPSQKRVYCSNRCQTDELIQKTSVNVNCAQCGNVCKKQQSDLKNSKHKVYFCSRKCKDEGQRLGGIEAIHPPHYGNSLGRRSELYRKKYKNAKKIDVLICERCGYKEFECGIDIHHIDGCHENNEVTNFMALCSPCHRGLHFGFWKTGQ